LEAKFCSPLSLIASGRWKLRGGERNSLNFRS
jgi:hypothetical protein